MVKTLLVLPVAYLVGSIPVAYLLVKGFYGRDIRRIGSRNVGAMNVARNLSFGLGLLTVLLDGLKGVLAVALAKYWAGSDLAVVLASLLVIAGDIWPVFLGFQGGKGLAVTGGTLLVIDGGILFWSLLVLGLVILVTNNVTIGVLAGCVLLPLLCWWQLGSFPWFFFGVVLALPLIAKHLRLPRQKGFKSLRYLGH